MYSLETTSSKNENKTFTGIDTLATGGYRTVTWTIGIKDDGRTLYAKAKNGVLCNQDIAYIQDGNGALATWATATAVKNQEVVYARMAPTNDMTEAAKSLLNYKAHNELADDVLKAEVSLIAWIDKPKEGAIETADQSDICPSGTTVPDIRYLHSLYLQRRLFRSH